MKQDLWSSTNIKRRSAGHKDISRGVIALAVVATLLGSSLMSRVGADAGDLDPAFGSGGIVITDFGFASWANALLIQADGKLVVAGFGGPSDGNVFLIARYNPNGSLDTSFGSGGKVITDFGSYESVSAAALDANGRIVVAGKTDDDKIALARYKTDGSLDSTFGTGGKVITPGNLPFSISDMALQTDGKIVVVGTVTTIPNIEMNTGVDFLTVRYTSTGSLDPSFGDDGFVRTDFNQPKDLGNAVLIQNDGKIVVAGYTNPESGNGFSFDNSDFCMARYNPDGSLDSTFGTIGKVVSNFAFGTGCVEAVLQKDGKILLVGFAENSTKDFALARYNANGSLDPSFGSGGLALTDFAGSPSSYDRALSVALQEDGKIVVAGSIGSYRDSALARYNADGTLDASFGTGGKVVTDIDQFDGFYDVAIYGSGQIVASAYTQHGVPQGDGTTQLVFNFALARYQDDGTPTSANLAVTLTASRPTNVITYTITVTNYGFDPSYYVTLKDTVPPNTTFVSFTAPSGWVVLSRPLLGQTGTVSVSRAKMIDPHPPFTSSATFTLVVRLSSAASGTTISNRAYVSSSFTPDPYAANDRDIVYTSVP